MMNRQQLHYLSWICKKMWVLAEELERNRTVGKDFLKLSYGTRRVIVEIPKSMSEYSLEVFPGIEHLFETFRDLGGVRYVVHVEGGAATVRVNPKILRGVTGVSNFTVTSPTKLWRQVRKHVWG